MKRYLYHYTSIETLEKILDSGCLCFTNLDLVDDLDEVETADINKFGRFCFVSCWTNEEKESIPMWKMYTPDMQGVRIKIEEFPFKKYIFLPGQYSNSQTLETYINMKERDQKGLPCILPEFPKLIEIDYTERTELLYPSIKNINTTFSEKTMVENGQLKKITNTNTTTTYKTDYIGAFKRKCWNFQKEWRYKIFLSPFTYKELANCTSPDDHVRLISRLEDDLYKPVEERIFLELASEAIKNMEIVVGPRATNKQLEIVRNIAVKYGIDVHNVKRSELRIR